MISLPQGYAGQTPVGPSSGHHHHHHPQMLYKKRAYEEAPQRYTATGIWTDTDFSPAVVLANQGPEQKSVARASF